MTKFIELADRVLSVRLRQSRRRPDRWRLELRIESGPGWDRAQAERVATVIRDEIDALGGNVIRWMKG